MANDLEFTQSGKHLHVKVTGKLTREAYEAFVPAVDQQIQVIDPRHISIVLDRAYAPTLVLNALSAGVASIVDREVVQSHERDGDYGHGWLRRASAGSGAYRLERWNPGEHVILEAAADTIDRDGEVNLVRHEIELL